MTATSNYPSLRNPGVLLATWFGVGYLPKAPGTWGSFAALPFAWVIYNASGWVGLAVSSLIIFLIGVWSANVYMRQSGVHDPAPVVIDEVAGQWLTLLVVAPDPFMYAAGFALFRIFDVFKPWPVSWADRCVPGPLGVMADDVLAAGYAAAILYGISVWFGG